MSAQETHPLLRQFHAQKPLIFANSVPELVHQLVVGELFLGKLRAAGYLLVYVGGCCDDFRWLDVALLSILNDLAVLLILIVTSEILHDSNGRYGLSSESADRILCMALLNS